MNKKLLQKVIDAIKENKIEYAMGILDTLIENLPDTVNTSAQKEVKVVIPIQDEAEQLELMARAKLAGVKQMSEYA